MEPLLRVRGGSATGAARRSRGELEGLPPRTDSGLHADVKSRYRCEAVVELTGEPSCRRRRVPRS